MRELYKVLHIEGNPFTVYYSQTNSQTECINQEIEQYLCLYVDYKQSVGMQRFLGYHTSNESIDSDNLLCI